MLAEMASGAAHELNNPLAVISGRAQLLADEADDGPLRDALRLIQDHAKRCSHVVSELMEFAQPASPDPTNVDLGGLLEAIRASWLGTGEMTAERFQLTLEPDANRVWADEEQLRTIIGELVRNGVEAADGGNARLIVNCRRDLTDETVVIEVQDHGRGMEPDVLARAFDPFFSHRPAGRGRGLGLSRAHRLAELAEGTLWLESTPSQGTTACLKLPTRPGRRIGQTARNAETTWRRGEAKLGRAGCAPGSKPSRQTGSGPGGQ